MRGGRRRWITGGAIGLSVATHLVLVVAGPRWTARRSVPPDEGAVEIVVLGEPGSTAAAHAEDVRPAMARAAPTAATATTAASARRLAAASQSETSGSPPPVLAEEESGAVEVVLADERPAVCDVLLEPGSHPGCVPAPERPSLDTWRVIAPGEVARSELARSAGAGATAPPDAGVHIGRALSEDLARVANTTPHLSKRPPPRLRRSRDGSYRYDGVPFDAVIEPDGTVTFEDHRLGMPAPGVFTFDVTDEAMRAAGQDPYQHERQWFMSETLELRDRLADEARERERRAAMRGLESRLAGIWSDSKRSAAERRRAIFALWDDCADDPVGLQARRIVVRFIRERLPQGSADAYTAAELRAFNAGRVSPEPFAPYG